MAKLNKKWTTLACALSAALLGTFFVGFIFKAPTQRLRAEVTRSSKILQEEKTLLARKPALQSEWDAKKDMLGPGLEPDALQNAWVKELLACAQTQSLVLEKLEPAGVRTGAGGKTLTVFITFQGDIRQLVSFIYRLAEKDPLSRIESFNIRREEDSTSLSFELLLGKMIR